MGIASGIVCEIICAGPGMDLITADCIAGGCWPCAGTPCELKPTSVEMAGKERGPPPGLHTDIVFGSEKREEAEEGRLFGFSNEFRLLVELPEDDRCALFRD